MKTSADNMGADSTGDGAALDRRFLAACAAARAAGGLARRHFADRGALRVEQKGPQDPVSIADRAAEALIVAGLGAAFPGDGFLGEEGGGQEAGKMADRLWVIDPIDGTANFVRGLSEFCVSLAYVEDGVPQIGVIYAPMSDELFAARRGRGATCNGVPMAVSGCGVLAEAMVGLSYSVALPAGAFLHVMDRMLAAGCEFRRPGSTALGLAYVAAGRLDAFWTARTRSWDVLAGLVLVREAGGVASDFPGGDGLLEKAAALGSNAALHPLLAPLLAAG
jgi:myo-inositol-1(or 4)-monophosphatase